MNRNWFKYLFSDNTPPDVWRTWSMTWHRFSVRQDLKLICQHALVSHPDMKHFFNLAGKASLRFSRQILS